MQIKFKPAFERSLKRLSSIDKKQAQFTVEKTIRYLALGEKTPGLGFKHLRGGLWEIRSGIRTRILFQKNDDTTEFILVGSHDDITRILKHIRR